jgi:hypothetical protein
LRNKVCKFAGAAVAAFVTGLAQATVVDFEDIAVDGGTFLHNASVVSRGFNVAHAERAEGGFALVDGNAGQGGTDFSGNGTSRLLSFNASRITVAPVAGGEFDIISFDGGESWISQPHQWSTQIEAVGYLAVGGTTTQVFDLDLIKDPVLGLQTFTFNNSFRGLTRVEFIGIGGNPEFSLDNVAVQAVPEPETYALMLGGLSAVAFMARRRQLRHAA